MLGIYYCAFTKNFDFVWLIIIDYTFDVVCILISNNHIIVNILKIVNQIYYINVNLKNYT